MRARRLYLSAALALALVLCQAPVHLAGADAQSPEQDIAYWASIYQVSPGLMTEMANLESGMNPGAWNPSGASGLFQFEPASWDWMKTMENDDTSYAPGLAAQRVYDPVYGDMWDPWEAAHLTAWSLAHGYGCQWVSYQMLTNVC